MIGKLDQLTRYALMAMLRTNIEIFKYTTRMIIKSRKTDCNRAAANQSVVLPNSIKRNHTFVDCISYTFFPVVIRFIFSDFCLILFLKIPESIHFGRIDFSVVHSYLHKLDLSLNLSFVFFRRSKHIPNHKRHLAQADLASRIHTVCVRHPNHHRSFLPVHKRIDWRQLHTAAQDRCL